MRYSLEIRKFIYSQYFFGGLRIALGVSLPAILMLLVFHNRELGFTIGELRGKHERLITQGNAPAADESGDTESSCSFKTNGCGELQSALFCGG